MQMCLNVHANATHFLYNDDDGDGGEVVMVGAVLVG